MFPTGIDLNDMMKLGQELGEYDDVARKGVILERLIKLYQVTNITFDNTK